MAARNSTSTRSLTRGLVMVAGSFAPNGTGTIAATSRKGNGWSVARTSAGLYTVTFSDKWNDLIAAIVTAQMVNGSGADLVPQVGTWTPGSKTLAIRLLAVATETDMAANANNRINFICWFSNTSEKPSAG